MSDGRHDFLATMRLRALVLNRIRSFLTDRGFTEVTTPSLMLTADPAVHLDSFRTELKLMNGQKRQLFLSTSPEYHMKRLLASGMEFIFQICPFFRDGELTPLHNPEFMGLEWYATGMGYEGLMDFTEELVRNVARESIGATRVSRCGLKVDLGQAFHRISVRQALLELGGVETDGKFEPGSTRAALEKAGIKTDEQDRLDDLVNRVLVERVEPRLAEMGPVFLYDYPEPMAALARTKPQKPWLAERFELYAGGLELCNGFGELTDTREQRRRFEVQCEIRLQDGRYAPEIDEAFLGALEQGLPACSGCALGIDRLIMLLAGKKTIREAMAFALEQELHQDIVTNSSY